MLVEQALDLPSFRPQLRLPIVVPAIGFLGSLIAMFIVNLVFAVAAVAIVVAILVTLVRRRIGSPFSDVRSEMFEHLSRWAGERAKATRESSERAWRPNLLISTCAPDRLDRALPFLHDVVHPKGSIKIAGHGDDISSEDVARVGQRLQNWKVSSSWSVVDADSVGDAVAAAHESGDANAAPNIVFIDFPSLQEEARQAEEALAAAHEHGLGVLVLSHTHGGRIGGRRVVNLWIRPQLDVDVQDIQHSHLSILLALKLQRNWGGQLNLLTVVDDEEDRGPAESYLRDLIDAARLPGPPSVHVLTGSFDEALPRSPIADMNVFALGPHADLHRMHELIEEADTPCAFVRDSGGEDCLI